MGVSCEATKDGLMILNVVEGSSAQKKGLQKNDILYSLDGEKLDSREELTILISGKKPNEAVTIEYHRGEKQLSLRVVLGERPTE